MTVDLERLEALEREATPGPWQWVDPDTDLPCLPDAPCATGDHDRHAYRFSLRTVAKFPTQSVGSLSKFVISSAEEFNEHEQADGSWTHPDAELIVEAVNALPELIASARELEQVKAENERLLALSIKVRKSLDRLLHEVLRNVPDELRDDADDSSALVLWYVREVEAENERLQGVLDFVRAGDGGLLQAGVLVAQRLSDAILDIDAHATPFGEDEDGFVNGGYLVSVGSLHRALGLVGKSSAKCRNLPCEQAAAAQAERDVLKARLETAVTAGTSLNETASILNDMLVRGDYSAEKYRAARRIFIATNDAWRSVLASTPESEKT